MEKCEVVIIGAGVMGCALAYEFSQKKDAVIVLEQGPRIAEGVTSRNSGVIHAGIYYPPFSLKSQSCIRGKALLYEWCEQHHVPFKKLGKWIVGSFSEQAELEAIYSNAVESGAPGLTLHSSLPEISGVRADIGIFSSETGIIDPFELSRSLQHKSQEQNNEKSLGTEFLLDCKVLGISRLSSGNYEIETSRGSIQAECIINAAGLEADEIARMVGIEKYTIYPCRGDYFTFKPKVQYSHLIYPVRKKNAPGLGVHLTLGLDGRCRLGPDTEYVESKYDFSPPKDLEKKRRLFFDSASQLLTGLELEQIEYDTCGIRPKLRSPQESVEKDFVLSQDLPGFINLIGIESPGLTASLDLAKRTALL